MNRQQLLFTYTEKIMAHTRMWDAEWNKESRCGLTSSQAKAIVLLKRLGPLQAKEVMVNLAFTSGGVTVLADKLIDKGLIRKLKDGSDRRAIILELTEEGHRLSQVVEEDWNRVMDKLFSVLSDVEVAILAQLFTKLVGGK